MLTESLKEVGGSVMLAVPPAVLEQLDLKVGSEVALLVEGNRLVIETKGTPKYTLQGLLDECDFDLPMSQEEREWLYAPTVGREAL